MAKFGQNYYGSAADLKKKNTHSGHPNGYRKNTHNVSSK